jgi:hypothetical protein
VGAWIIQLAEQASVDRRFANSLYVKMRILLHFAKIILDFTHTSILSSAPHELAAKFFPSWKVYRAWEPSYSNSARLLHLTVSVQR